MSRYIAERGDTLWGVAASRLGDANRWSEIAKLNDLRPPYLIVTGQLLRLPARAPDARASSNPRNVSNLTPSTSMPRSSDRRRSASTPASERPTEHGAGALPGRAFLFILADEVLPSGKLVRKVLQHPKTLTESISAKPELYGIKPKNPTSTVSIGEHALGNTNSRFTSASSLPRGAPNMSGRPIFIDIAKARAAGATIHSSEAIISDLQRLAQVDSSLKPRVEKLASVIRSIEGEVLVEGNVPAHAIKSGGAMAATRSLRFVSAVGAVFTVYDLGNATVKSVDQRSVNPIAAEGLRQAGGWGMGWIGMKTGCAAGALVGIETGPGAVLTCGVGGLIFGTAGYLGADWLADFIDAN